jgi:hypothetical protein
MQQPPLLPPTATRRCHTKSRAGCTQCKKRHVKISSHARYSSLPHSLTGVPAAYQCDESKPRCGYCIKRGIACSLTSPVHEPEEDQPAPQKRSSSFRVPPSVDDSRREPALSRHSLDGPDARQRSFASPRAARPGDHAPQDPVLNRSQHDDGYRGKEPILIRGSSDEDPDANQNTSSRKPVSSPQRRGKKPSLVCISSDDDDIRFYRELSSKEHWSRKPSSKKTHIKSSSHAGFHSDGDETRFSRRPSSKRTHTKSSSPTGFRSDDDDTRFSRMPSSKRPHSPSKHVNLRSVMDTLREIEGRGKRSSSYRRPYKSSATTATTVSQKSVSGYHVSDQVHPRESDPTRRLHKRSLESSPHHLPEESPLHLPEESPLPLPKRVKHEKGHYAVEHLTLSGESDLYSVGGRKSLDHYLHICEYVGCTHRCASQDESSAHWYSQYADDCYDRRNIRRWTDTVRSPAVEAFRVPADDLSTDILRYKFAGNFDVPVPPHPRTKMPHKTIADQISRWKSCIERLSYPTPYNHRHYADATMADMFPGASTVLHHVIKGRDLDVLLQSNISEVDDEVEEDAIGSDDDGILHQPVDDIQYVDAGPKPSRRDMQLYVASLSTAHRADSELQYRTACQVIGELDSYATFRCPFPDCKERFDP